MPESNQEEEEDEENEENEDEDEENEDEGDEDGEEDEDEEGDEEGEDEDGDEEEKKKEPDPPKISKYQSLLNALRDINMDLDNVDRDVDRVYTKVQTARSKFREEPRPRRNYHDPMDRDEIKKSFSPRWGNDYNNRHDGYESDYRRRQDEEEEFNDRDYRRDREQDQMMHSGG